MPKKALLRPSKIFHPTSTTELHIVHTVFHIEVLGKEPLVAGLEPCQADEGGNFNKTFPGLLALNGDSGDMRGRIKLLLSSPAVNVLEHKMSPNTDTVLSPEQEESRRKYLRYENSLSRNIIVKYFSSLSLICTVPDPKLNAMTTITRASVVELPWEHLLWDAEHGAWNQVFSRSADLAAPGRSSLSKVNKGSERREVILRGE